MQDNEQWMTNLWSQKLTLSQWLSRLICLFDITAKQFIRLYLQLIFQNSEKGWLNSPIIYFVMLRLITPGPMFVLVNQSQAPRT